MREREGEITSLNISLAWMEAREMEAKEAKVYVVDRDTH